MTAQTDDYRAAYADVVAAETIDDPEARVEALASAHERLRAAERSLAARLQALWQRNLAAVQDAKAAVVEASRERLRVESEVAVSARARDPYRPVLNVDELARATAAYTTVQETRTALAAAQAAFKAGVTPDQMESDSVLR